MKGKGLQSMVLLHQLVSFRSKVSQCCFYDTVSENHLDCWRQLWRRELRDGGESVLASVLVYVS